MFTDRHYVPAIRWRQGEYSALQELRANQRENLTPLADIPPIPWDFINEQPARTIDQHMENVPAQMLAAWGEPPIFVDLGLVDSDVRMANGRHPIDDLFQRLYEEGVHAIPVTATDRDADYQAAIQTVLGRDDHGLCIRASADDLEIENGFTAFAGIVDASGLGLDEIDLVLDFRAIDANQVNLLRQLVVNVIASIPSIADYRTLTLLTGAFPVNMTNVPLGLSALPRADWALWLAVRGAAPARLPSFGDYTANYPDQEEIDPRYMQPSANIRYAGEDDWVIARGRSVRSPRFGQYGQYNVLSQRLVGHPQYAGNSFSWASDFIDTCAGGGPTGNLTSWRKVATNRHMALAGHQIASLA